MITASEAARIADEANTIEHKIKCILNEVNKAILDMANNGYFGCNICCPFRYLSRVLGALKEGGFNISTVSNGYKDDDQIFITWHPK